MRCKGQYQPDLGKKRSRLKAGTIMIMIAVLNLWSCFSNNRQQEIPMNWTAVESVNHGLEKGIRVYYGHNSKLPLNAWYVSVDLADSSVRAQVVVSNDTDRRESPSQFAQRLDACVVVNGGYFLMQKNPTSHVGLLMIEHELVEPASRSFFRSANRYFTARGALGFLDDGSADVAWVTSRNDSLFEWQQPIPNSPGFPVTSLDFSKSRYWPVRDALHAGPVLITDGQIHVTVDEEIFFESSIPQVHPRTAAGYTEDNRLILMVVDGRQAASRGVYLEELARLLKDLGCVEALNLDGGGSSALVVNGQLINRPGGGTTQREIMSGIALICR